MFFVELQMTARRAQIQMNKISCKHRLREKEIHVRKERTEVMSYVYRDNFINFRFEFLFYISKRLKYTLSIKFVLFHTETLQTIENVTTR